MDNILEEDENSQSSMFPNSSGQGNKDESDDDTEEEVFVLAEEAPEDISHETIRKTVRNTDELEDRAGVTGETSGRTSPADSYCYQGLGLVCNPSENGSRCSSVSTVQENCESQDGIRYERNRYGETYPTATASNYSVRERLPELRSQREEVTERISGQNPRGSQDHASAFMPIHPYPDAGHLGGRASNRTDPLTRQSTSLARYLLTGSEPSELPPRRLSTVNEQKNDKPETHHPEVLVKGVSKETSRETLDMYFQNTARSGGGKIWQSHLDKIRGRYRVRFKSAKVARSVVSKEHHKVDGKELTVTLYQPPTASGEPRRLEETSRTVAVQGFEKTPTTVDHLWLYFESVKRSGGGEVTDVSLEEDLAFVSFKHPEDAKRVVSRKQTLNRKPLIVVLHEDLDLLPGVFCVEGLQCALRNGELHLSEDLINFIEGRTQVPVHDVCFGKESVVKGTALIVFEDDIEINVLKAVIESTQFYGLYLTVKPVPVSCTVEVHDLPDSTSLCEETLENYFNNTMQSGGQNVTEVVISQRREYALVTFADPEVCSIVLNRSHVIHGETLDVRTYFDCVGVNANDIEPVAVTLDIPISEEDQSRIARLFLNYPWKYRLIAASMRSFRAFFKIQPPFVRLFFRWPDGYLCEVEVDDQRDKALCLLYDQLDLLESETDSGSEEDCVASGDDVPTRALLSHYLLSPPFDNDVPSRPLQSRPVPSHPHTSHPLPISTPIHLTPFPSHPLPSHSSHLTSLPSQTRTSDTLPSFSSEGDLQSRLVQSRPVPSHLRTSHPALPISPSSHLTPPNLPSSHPIPSHLTPSLVTPFPSHTRTYNTLASFSSEGDLQSRLVQSRPVPSHPHPISPPSHLLPPNFMSPNCMSPPSYPPPPY